MATRDRPIDRGRRIARHLAVRSGEEIRIARIGSGLSRRAVAEAAGMSRTQVARIETADFGAPTIDQISRAAVAVGLRVSVRLFPDADPVRDAGHHRLLERFRVRLHPTLRWRTEIPLGLPGDLRSWDAETGTLRWKIKVEAETHIGDTQALERKLALKRRDDGDPIVIILVADTRHNAAVLRSARGSLRTDYPLDTRQVLSALSDGRDPGQGGIVVL